MNRSEEQLSSIKKRLEEGEEVKFPVRQLLSWFGFERRSRFQTPVVRSALHKHELETIPDFDIVWIDHNVKFALVVKTPSKSKPSEGPEQIAPSDEDAPERVVTYRLGRLQAVNKPMTTVGLQHDLATAVTLMMQNDFSQLPVMSGAHSLKGIITWQAIGRKLALGRPAQFVKDVTEPVGERIAGFEDVLFDAIEKIIKHDFVLVKAKDGTISGIVTTSDLSHELHDLTVPFLLVGEIENHLRKLSSKLPTEVWKSASNPDDGTRVISEPSDLTIGEHIRMLDNPDNWLSLGILLDRAEVLRELKEVVRVRNDIMHFDYDRPPPPDLDLLRRVVRLFQQLDHEGLI